MTSKLNKTRAAVLLGATLMYVQPSAAQEPNAGHAATKVFSVGFTGVAPVADDQVRLVYYRSRTGIQRNGAAHLYIDRDFHTGLMPGGYSTFCLAPGSQTLGAYLDDAPTYFGKNRELYTATLVGGQTYYLKVREDGNTFPA